MKRTVPLIITFAIGLSMVVVYFVPNLGFMTDLASIHFDILAGIAFVLGGGNLLRTHGEKVFKQREGWGYSGITVITFLLTLTFGLAKVGVTPRPGFTATLSGSGSEIGFVTLNIAGAKKFTLEAAVSGVAAESTHVISIAGRNLGEIKANRHGRGDLKIEYSLPKGDGAPQADQTAPAAYLTKLKSGDTVRIGTVVQGQLKPFGRIMGELLDNGAGFWFLFEYGFKPLQATTFAMLAFYVASAAFRAFRAKNVESVLLLGTAFVILTGRTYLGTVLTGWLPETGFWSFFHVPNFSQWIMNVFNTAGNRAIMIGIALGIASTSLKVLLGIDRSYLGSDRE